MKPTIRAVVILLAAAILVTAVAGFSLMRRGVSARGEPSTIEAVAARAMRRLATPRRVRAAINPVEFSEDTLNEALAHFADHHDHLARLESLRTRVGSYARLVRVVIVRPARIVMGRASLSFPRIAPVRGRRWAAGSDRTGAPPARARITWHGRCSRSFPPRSGASLVS